MIKGKQKERQRFFNQPQSLQDQVVANARKLHLQNDLLQEKIAEYTQTFAAIQAKGEAFIQSPDVLMDIVSFGFLQSTGEESLTQHSAEYLSDDNLRDAMKRTMKKVVSNAQTSNEEKVKSLISIGVEIGLAYKDYKSTIAPSSSK